MSEVVAAGGMSVRMSCSAIGKLRERRAGELETQSQPLASAAEAPGVCGLRGMESQAWRAAPSLCPEVRARVMQGSVVQTHCGDFLWADQRDLTNCSTANSGHYSDSSVIL